MTAGRGQEPAGQYRHRSVLLDSAVDLLVNDPDGVYVDGTFGRGGHSRLILGRLGQGGKVLGIDKDPDAIQVARDLSASDARFQPFHGSFAELGAAAEAQGWMKVNGVLLDLGVSSPQLDDATRGFSFMRDGPLDMRMDPGQAPSAAQWLAEADEKDIANVIWRYGEEKFSRRIARLVVERRKEVPLETTRQLASLVSEAVPKKEKHKHPATRTFQALRIWVNRELDGLDVFLRSLASRLAAGARMVIISFHSLEDRIVKHTLRELEQGGGVDLRVLTRRPVRPGPNEVSRNPRARSARLRAAERLA